jgi:hypothetical protein
VRSSTIGAAKQGTSLRTVGVSTELWQATNVVRLLRIIGVSGWLPSCREFPCRSAIWTVGLARLTHRAGRGQCQRGQTEKLPQVGHSVCAEAGGSAARYVDSNASGVYVAWK